MADLLNSSNQLLPLILSALGLFFEYLPKQVRHAEFSKERLEILISPLFELIEPCMCLETETFPSEIVKVACQLIEDHRVLSGGRLREYANYFLSGNRSMLKFMEFCSVVSFEYDRLCRNIDIPLRRRKYRMQTYKRPYSYHDAYAHITESLLKILSIFSIALALLLILLSVLFPSAFIEVTSFLTGPFFIFAGSVSAVVGVYLLILGIRKTKWSKM